MEKGQRLGWARLSGADGARPSKVTSYDGKTNSLFIAKPEGSEIVIEVYDSDGWGSDDFMGGIAFTRYTGESRDEHRALTSNGDARISFTVDCIQ